MYFYRMVADISLESLNSLSDEENVTASRLPGYDAIPQENTNPEQNNNTRQKRDSLTLSELDNDRAPGDKLLRSTHTRMSPASCLQNLNDWDLQYSFSELTSPLTTHSSMRLSSYSVTSCAEEGGVAGDEECCFELMSTSSHSTASSSRDAGLQPHDDDDQQTIERTGAEKIDSNYINTPQAGARADAINDNPLENYINPIASSTLQTPANNCATHIDHESNNNDSQRSTGIAAARAEVDDVLLCHGGQTPDLIRSLNRDRSVALDDVTECLRHEMCPTVTLSGSKNDGSYEIDIQNIFPQAYKSDSPCDTSPEQSLKHSAKSPVQSKPAQIYAPVSKKNLEFRTFQDKYPHSLYKPMHGVDRRDVTLKSLKTREQVEGRLRTGSDRVHQVIY